MLAGTNVTFGIMRSTHSRKRPPCADQVKGGGTTVGRVHQPFRCSLHSPDSERCQSFRTYSPRVREALSIAYTHLHNPQASTEERYDAYAALITHRRGATCPDQLMRLEYALALAYSGDSSIPEALDALSVTLELASLLDDHGAQAEASYLAGALFHSLAQHAAAYDAYGEARDQLRLFQEDTQARFPDYELDIVLRMAGRALDLGWFATCQRHLDEAGVLRADCESDDMRLTGALAWLDAQLARDRGDPVRAVHQGEAALVVYEQLDQRLNEDRLSSLVAEMLCDSVEASGWRPNTPPGAVPMGDPALHPARFAAGKQDPDDMLRRARLLAQGGGMLARQERDAIGLGMAELALDRVYRLMGRYRAFEGSIAVIEDVIRSARQVNDMSLLGRAETALGETLFAAGRVEAACLSYFRAQTLLAEHQLDGLAIRPQRALVALTAHRD